MGDGAARPRMVWLRPDRHVLPAPVRRVSVCVAQGRAGLGAGPDPTDAALAAKSGVMMANGDTHDHGLTDPELPLLTTTVEKVVQWARRSAIWPAQFGLAC